MAERNPNERKIIPQTLIQECIGGFALPFVVKNCTFGLAPSALHITELDNDCLSMANPH